MRIHTILFALLSCCVATLQAQDTLLLFHPTAYNLDIIENLSREGMLNLEGYHVLGVYHSREAYIYESAIQKAAENPDGIVSLMEISGKLVPGNLFGVNDCTPLFKELFDRSRGALFMGGPDIPPILYKEPVHLLTNVTDPFRHYMEASFLFHLLGGNQNPQWIPCLERNDKYLVSGICLGMQTMNVATGGTMIQDIPTEVYSVWTAEEVLEMPSDQMHRNYLGMVHTDCDEPTSYHFHQLSLNKKSFLRKGLKFKKPIAPLVLSSHHQAIEAPGKGWVVAATSIDGKIIEAIEHERFPHVFGVQFHPEKPGLFDPSIIHPISCHDRINFRDVIRETDSYPFHQAYWNYIGRILQKREKE
ncbi:MAG: hypothetical protein GY790_14880 [Bacteroidetes bacterium]|nr:hypothetical protein [Bacteroidota bacterium]